MKILHIVGDSKFGGGSVIISQLAAAQLDKGYIVEVLTTDSEFKSHLNKIGVCTVHIDCIWRNYNPITDLLGIIKLRKFLKNSSYDVIHTHTTKAGFVGRVAAKLAGIKTIFHTVHGFPFSESSSRVKVFVFSQLEKLLYKISSKVIFVSNYHLEWARKLSIVTNSNGVAIRNGIDKIDYSSSELFFDDVNGLPVINILYIGRVVKEKGLFDLVLAFRRLLDSNPNVNLYIIGDGPDLAELKQFSSTSKNIHFKGFVNNATEYLSKSDIFVLPSYREGLSISAIEAQAYGIPSLLSDIGGNVEISANGVNALLFEVGNVDSMLQKLELLINSKDKRLELSSFASRNFDENFTRDKMVSNYIDLYRKEVSAK